MEQQIKKILLLQRAPLKMYSNYSCRLDGRELAINRALDAGTYPS
jgi:hypothetical protein